MLLAPLVLQAAPILVTGTPADNSRRPNTPVSPNLGGVLVNFDSVTSCQTFPPSGCANLSGSTYSGITFTSPDGLYSIPYSGQSTPNEIFDNGVGGSANLTLSLNRGTNAIGIGIVDSDVNGNGNPVEITLQALDSLGANLGSAFTVTIPELIVNPGNGYFVIRDTTNDIFGLRISQAVSDPNFSGLAIDDVQIAPEPSTVLLLLTGLAVCGIFRMFSRSGMRRGFFATENILLCLGTILAPFAAEAQTPGVPTTPIQHVVVIFSENESFDHYFGTYPKATNPPGQPRFIARPNTPAANNYQTNPTLLTNNPNLNPANGTGAANPFRLNRTQALTPSQGHSYTPEQNSFDLGLMDLFPSKTGSAGSSSNMSVLTPAVVTTKGIVMGYYDGNTVTALWNYAQNFAMSDNSYNSGFGPSTPGAFNLISGQTNGIIQATALNAPSSNEVADGRGGFTMIGDAEPLGDVCSSLTSFNAAMSGKNVGDLLNAANVTWGWFNGGFDLSIVNPNGTTGCRRSTVSPITGLSAGDYIPHHQPFQYYATTANPNHTRPLSAANIGFTDQANHQYDIHDFFDALSANNLPAVSFLKAAAYQDAHPGNSNPLDEQAFIVNVVNSVASSSFWNNTAIIVAYDDSDGWYDHQQGPIVNGSFSTSDTISGPGACGTKGATAQLAGPNSNGLPVDGRCGPGVRTPLLVISPWTKANYIDHTFTIQTSVLRFIEENWTLGKIGGGSFDNVANPIDAMFDFSNPAGPAPNTNKLILSTATGLPVQ